jgi:8-amino-3,8-dideoxy-alpha-D-manno-octulosonate transaminase
MTERTSLSPPPAHCDPAHRPPGRSRPDRDRVMRLGSAQVGAAELRAVEEVLRNQVFYRYHGSTVAAFERQFSAKVVSGQGALAVNSGSSALQVAFAALDEDPGFEVLVPVLGFVSAATAVIAAGGVPRFVPVDASLGIDTRAASHLITARTRAILAVHPYGAGCDLTAVRQLAAEHDLHVVEDVAQACGASFQGQPLGTHGSVAAFSFQHFKLLSTGEGGLVTSADPQIMDRAQNLHDAASYWVTPDAARRTRRLRMAPGNLRMSELEGALGLAQLARLGEWTGQLRAGKQRLAGYVASISGLSLRPLADPAGEIGTTLAFFCPDAASASEIAGTLKAEGVNAGPLLGPPGTNRHFAGDWAHVLSQCGMPPAPAEVIAVTRNVLDTGVLIALDLRYDEQDLAETVLALERAIPR